MTYTGGKKGTANKVRLPQGATIYVMVGPSVTADLLHEVNLPKHHNPTYSDIWHLLTGAEGQKPGAMAVECQVQVVDTRGGVGAHGMDDDPALPGANMDQDVHAA